MDPAIILRLMSLYWQEFAIFSRTAVPRIFISLVILAANGPIDENCYHLERL
jgi:hypothetical protein